jgi:predicted PurR-regulated permease PerM
LAFGVIGLFLGPTLLAVGYRLALEWTAKVEDSAAQADTTEPGST